MKRLLVFLVLICMTLSLFAKWSVGQIVDDFDDPTGEEFVYLLTEGTFSNTATSNSKSCVRVLSQFVTTPYPSERWTFEVHDYNWDNPVDDYYDDSTATIKIKEDNGNVVTFTKSNSEYSHSWNTLKPADGYRFTQMLKDNNSLKVSISIEKSKYVFTIDCSDFNDIFDKAFSSCKSGIGSWKYSAIDESTMEFYKYLKSMYANMKMTKYFPTGSYTYYGEQLIGNEWYLFYFNLDNADYSTNKYVAIDFGLDRVDKSLGTPVTTDIESKDVKEVYLLAGTEQKKMKLSDGSFTWSCSESTQNIVNKMATSSTAGIKIVLKNGKTLTFNFDGKEFAKNYEAAKNISQI